MISTNQLFEQNNKLTIRTRVSVFVIKNNKFIIGKPTNVFKYKYIIPGGGIEGNETIQEAANRECREEISVIPKNIRQIQHQKNPIIYCNLKKYDFKYDCTKFYACYSEYGGRDKSTWGTEDGFKCPPIEISLNELIKWLNWVINLTKTKNDYVKNLKYKHDLLMVNALIKKNIINFAASKKGK